MGDLGLDTAYGAGGGADALQQIFERRMQQAASDRAQKALEQNDALTRLKIQEQADSVRQRIEGQRQAQSDRLEASKAAEKDRQDRLALMQFNMTPAGGDVTPEDADKQVAAGVPSNLLPRTKGSQQTTGFMPLPSAPPQGPGMQAMGDLAPASNGPQPMGSLSPVSSGPQMGAGASTTAVLPDKATRMPTQADVVKQQADDLANRKEDNATQGRSDALELRQHLADITEKVRSGQLNNQEAMLAIRERLASVAEQNASSKASKAGTINLSQGGKSAKAAIEQAAPLTDRVLEMIRQEAPDIETNPQKYNGVMAKGHSLLQVAKYKAGFADDTDPRQQLVSLLQPIQAGQYTRSSRSRQMLELALKHMADPSQTLLTQYQRAKELKAIMPEMLEGIVRAEQPVDPAHPLGGSYFDPAKGSSAGKEIVYDHNGKPIQQP